MYGLILFFCTAVSLFAAEESVQVIVEGVTDIERSNVEAAIALPPGLVREGKVDIRWLERFEQQIPQKVIDSIEPFGYYKPKVLITRDKPDDGIYRLRVHIEKGAPVRLIKVDVRADGPGAREKALTDLIAQFPLHNGDVLRHDRYEQAKNALQNTLIDLGYLDASFSVHKIIVSLNTLQAEIELVLDSGPQYRFGNVTFTGIITYPDGFLRRYLQFRQGDIFSYEKIAATQANLTNTGRFREVAINPEKEKAVNLRVPVEIAIVPSPPKRFKIGGGFGTDTGPRASLYYQDVNIARRGHELVAEATVGTALQGIAARYTIPGQRDVNTFSSFRMAAQREDTTSYTTNSVTAEVERARSFDTGLIGSLFMQMQKEHSEAGIERTNSFLLMPGARLSERRFDKLIRPSKGFSYQMELKGTGKSIGSDTGFVQFISKGQGIIPLPKRFSISARVQAGTTWQDDPARNLPVTLRFFAGGDNSIRGYRYQALGPKGDNGEVVGGKHLLIGSIELERAIGESWGVAAFYDVGNAFNDFSNIDPAQGTGLGCRYYTPVGPIKLDLARQIAVESPGYRLHFSIGLEF